MVMQVLLESLKYLVKLLPFFFVWHPVALTIRLRSTSLKTLLLLTLKFIIDECNLDFLNFKLADSRLCLSMIHKFLVMYNAVRAYLQVFYQWPIFQLIKLSFHILRWTVCNFDH